MDGASNSDHLLGEEIARVAAQIDAGEHTLLTLLRRFDETRGWAASGALSCVQWLGWRVGQPRCTASEKLRIAHALGKLPHIDDAFRQNKVSYSKVRALTRVATPENEERLLLLAVHSTGNQLETICREYRKAASPAAVMNDRWVRQRLMPSGMVRIEAQLSAEEAALVMKALEASRVAMGLTEPVGKLDLSPQAEGQAPPFEDRESSAENTPRDHDGDDAAHGGGDGDGNGDAHAGGDGDGGGIDGVDGDELPEIEEDGWGLETRAWLEAQQAEAEREGRAEMAGTYRWLADQAEKPTARWAAPADALVFMAERFLAGDSAGGADGPRAARARVGGDRWTVMVHVEAKALAEGAPGVALEDGTRLSADTLRRVACDAGLVTVLEGAKGETIDVGRRTRAIPPAIQRALRRRDGGCQFPGCTNRVYVHAHHVEHWVHGGETRMGNLVTLCSAHHRLVHEGGFSVAAVAGGGFRFKAPDAAIVPAVPERPVDPGPLPYWESMPWPRWDGAKLDWVELSWALPV